jgi:DNA-binding Lrp family transcriptional regulator
LSKNYDKEVLENLIKDPTRSNKEIAKKLDSYRQKVWRERKKLEKENVIWGYTTVINERKINHVLYMVFLKTKPLDNELANIIHTRVKQFDNQEDVRVINLLLVNGEFDWILMFSAQNKEFARRYYDLIRTDGQDWLLEKPIMVDVVFPLVREGKINPELNRIFEIVSSA